MCYALVAVGVLSRHRRTETTALCRSTRADIKEGRAQILIGVRTYMSPGTLSQALQLFLRFAGKGQRKVVAVFGFLPGTSHAAVLHVRKGAPDVPVWLFSTSPPLPATAGLCERVHVNRSPVALLIEAERRLWRCWVALSVGTWTGERGQWLMKLAPFLIPPGRALLLNRHGDFFRGGCSDVLSHCGRQFRNNLHSGWNRGLDLAGAYGLLLASVLLRWCSYPHRRVFGRLHGDRELCLDAVSPCGDSLVRFLQQGQDWEGEALERLARESNARWILWQHEALSDAQADALAALFDCPRVFAVSRQCHLRAWKKTLIPTAPFRRLQAGEASQTLAPLSDTILVDRAMLLAIGIPRCKLAGTAWMLMFWKAAAAGWRSYSMGHSGHVEVEPDFPMQETAFLLRVLREGALRRLGPRDPGLSRGTIAFLPAMRPQAASDTGRLKVLIVSPFLPYPLAHGGAVRIYNLCRALADRVDFILAAVREKDEAVDYERLGRIFREVYAVDLDEPEGRDSGRPTQVRHYQSRSLRGLISRLCREWNPDLLQVEFTQMAGYRDCAREIPAVLVEHDLTFSLYRQLAREQPGEEAHSEYRRWLEFERHWLATYDGVWTVSEADRRTAMAEGERAADRTFTRAQWCRYPPLCSGGSCHSRARDPVCRFLPPPAQRHGVRETACRGDAADLGCLSAAAAARGCRPAARAIPGR